jgi:hypothetical protein
MVHNLIEFNLNGVTVILSENGVDLIQADCQNLNKFVFTQCNAEPLHLIFILLAYKQNTNLPLYKLSPQKNSSFTFTGESWMGRGKRKTGNLNSPWNPSIPYNLTLS